MSARDSLPTLPPGYASIDLIGRGGEAVVYRARHLATGAERAIKLIAGSFDPDALDRFRREGQALARLGGVGVVPIHETGQIGGRAFMVLELMPGGSLRERLRGAGRLDWCEAASLLVGLARTLARAHALGLVHRDLKPENVLFDDRGEARIADFGCARDLMASRALTKTGDVLGTPCYMAPEQLDGGKVDGRADVFALGVLLHELVLGERPWRGSDLGAVLSARTKGARLPSLTSAPGVPAALDVVRDHALAPDLASRTPDAATFAAELERVLAGGTLERPRRGRVLGPLALLGFLALAAALAVWAGSGRDRGEPPPVSVASPAPLTLAGALERLARGERDGTRELEIVAAAKSSDLRVAESSLAALVTRAIERFPEAIELRRARAWLGHVVRAEDLAAILSRQPVTPSPAALLERRELEGDRALEVWARVAGSSHALLARALEHAVRALREGRVADREAVREIVAQDPGSPYAPAFALLDRLATEMDAVGAGTGGAGSLGDGQRGAGLIDDLGAALKGLPPERRRETLAVLLAPVLSRARDAARDWLVARERGLLQPGSEATEVRLALVDGAIGPAPDLPVLARQILLLSRLDRQWLTPDDLWTDNGDPLLMAACQLRLDAYAQLPDVVGGLDSAGRAKAAWTGAEHVLANPATDPRDRDWAMATAVQSALLWSEREYVRLVAEVGQGADTEGVVAAARRADELAAALGSFRLDRATARLSRVLAARRDFDAVLALGLPRKLAFAESWFYFAQAAEAKGYPALAQATVSRALALAHAPTPRVLDLPFFDREACRILLQARAALAR